MVDEKEEYEGQEEGEYHFSDDQANFEVEPEMKAKEASEGAAAPAVPLLQRYKRPLIGIAVFFGLIFLVYLIITPSSNKPNVEFTEVKSAAVPKPTTAPNSSTVKVANTTPVSEPVPAPTPAPAVTVIAPPTPTPSEPVAEAPVVQPPSVSSENMPPPVVVSPAPTNATPAAAEAPSDADKLLALTQENAKVINQIQADYNQKTTEYDSQNVIMQGKLQDLSMRLASIEATLAQLSKSMREVKTAPPRSVAPSAEQMEAQAMPVEPRVTYTVQAIIPGRAWLKSDAGETVTVAEGDLLRGYGRVKKIDPYDGIVEIMVGGRKVTLSYGAGTDQQ